MTNLDHFWTHVANDLEREYGRGHPSRWKKRKIENFLIHFEQRILERCQEDEYITKSLKLPSKNGKPLLNILKVPTYYTFNRIFKSKTSRGTPYYQDQFTIYLGFESFDDYCSKKRIPASKSEQNLAQKTPPYKYNKNQIFVKLSLAKGYAWMIVWLTCSTLIHNIHGIVKGNLNYLPWLNIFWIPPLVIGLLAYYLGKVILNRSDRVKSHLSVIWILTIITQIYLNQKIPGWFHFIETASLFIMGIIGGISFSTELVLVTSQKNAAVNQRHGFANIFKYDLNITLLAYLFGLLFGLFLIAIIWIVPDETIRQYGKDLALFRLYCSIEMIIAFGLISIGFKKLIFNPILYINRHY